MLLPDNILEDIDAPAVSLPSGLDAPEPREDIFSAKARKAWHEAGGAEARCDFAPNRHGIHPRGAWFIHRWKRSVKGRTLSEIKADEEMIGFFADGLAPLISAVLGPDLAKGGFALVTTPPRRHKERNFGELMAADIARRLGVRFYKGCAVARSRERIGAVYDPGNIPEEPNVIVVDDIVTTGSTFTSMKELLYRFGKRCIFFAGINNST